MPTNEVNQELMSKDKDLMEGFYRLDEKIDEELDDLDEDDIDNVTVSQKQVMDAAKLVKNNSNNSRLRREIKGYIIRNINDPSDYDTIEIEEAVDEYIGKLKKELTESKLKKILTWIKIKCSDVKRSVKYIVDDEFTKKVRNLSLGSIVLFGGSSIALTFGSVAVTCAGFIVLAILFGVINGNSVGFSVLDSIF